MYSVPIVGTSTSCTMQFYLHPKPGHPLKNVCLELPTGSF